MSFVKNVAGAVFSVGLLSAPMTGHAQDINGAKQQFMRQQDLAREQAERDMHLASTQEDRGDIQVHRTMSNDAGVYARDLFIGHILSPDPRVNMLSQRGLQSLVVESYLRTSVEPEGVVGIDLEDPATLSNLDLIPVLYFPVTNQTPRLSEEARHALQNYTANGGIIVIDVIGGRMNTSEPLQQILADLSIRPPERISESHPLSQSFYFSNLQGSNSNASVWVERNASNLGEAGASSVIIGDQNWAGAWSASTVDGADQEEAVRAGLNILLYALSGQYKLDPIHQETIEQKRDYLEEEALRLREEGTSPE